MMNPSNNDCNYKSFINNDVCFGFELDDPFSFSFHVPSPYMHYEDEAVLIQDLHNLQMHQHPLTEENGVDSSKNYSVNYSKAEGCSKKSNSKAEEVPRKKCYKKDRHSKINTAHGPRDRRMRLSVYIAQEFFGLQDKLGFATASHTVGWLLRNSHSSIVELSKGLPQTNTSSTSECEAISAITKNQQECPKEKRSYTKEKKKVRRFNPISKQLREKARERARERTKEKILRVNEEKLHSSEGHNPQELRSLSPYKTTGEDSGTQDYINSYSYEMLREVEELSCHERQLPGTYQENIFNESMVAGGSWSQSEPFNFHLNEICSGPQFGDVQLQLPQFGDVQLQPQFGDVQLQPQFGDVQLQPQFGDVQLQPQFGDVQLQPQFGDVQLLLPQFGDVQLQPQFGDVQLLLPQFGDVQLLLPQFGDVQLQPQFGDVQLQLPQFGDVQLQPQFGDVQLQPQFGDVQLQPQFGDVQLQPQFGDVQLQLPQFGDVQLQPQFGDVQLQPQFGDVQLQPQFGDVQFYWNSSEAFGTTNL